MTPNRATANSAATTPMAMTVACGTSGDGDPPTFAEYDEVVLTPPEAFCGAVDDAAAEDDVDDGDGRGVLVGATDVVATVFATGAVVILYKLMYQVPPQIRVLFPIQGTPHQYSSTRSGFC